MVSDEIGRSAGARILEAVDLLKAHTEEVAKLRTLMEADLELLRSMRALHLVLEQQVNLAGANIQAAYGLALDHATQFETVAEAIGRYSEGPFGGEA